MNGLDLRCWHRVAVPITPCTWWRLPNAAGLILTWDDFRDLSDVVPLLAKVYPNGPADINAFHQAGGVPLLLRGLVKRGLLYGYHATDWQHGRLSATSAALTTSN